MKVEKGLGRYSVKRSEMNEETFLHLSQSVLEFTYTPFYNFQFRIPAYIGSSEPNDLVKRRLRWFSRLISRARQC